MLMRLITKGEYLIVPKGTNIHGADTLGLNDSHNESFCLTHLSLSVRMIYTQGWTKCFHPQEQHIFLPHPVNVQYTAMWRSPQLSLSFPGNLDSRLSHFIHTWIHCYNTLSCHLLLWCHKGGTSWALLVDLCALCHPNSMNPH